MTESSERMTEQEPAWRTEAMPEVIRAEHVSKRFGPVQRAARHQPERAARARSSA